MKTITEIKASNDQGEIETFKIGSLVCFKSDGHIQVGKIIKITEYYGTVKLTITGKFQGYFLKGHTQLELDSTDTFLNC